MNIYLKSIELKEQQPSIANDEDYIALYENGADYIYYVRNYVMSQEFIVVSAGMFELLPLEHRPITNVFVRSNFYVLRRYKRLIREHVLQSGQLLQFQHLFDCSVAEFFENI